MDLTISEKIVTSFSHYVPIPSGLVFTDVLSLKFRRITLKPKAECMFLLNETFLLKSVQNV